MSDKHNDTDIIYTLTLIFSQYFEEDGEVVNVPVFLPYSYSSEEAARVNAEVAEAIYGEELESWGITKVGLDREITANNSGQTVH